MIRRTIVLILMCAAAKASAAQWLDSPELKQQQADWQLQKVAEGLKDGWGLAFLPDQRLLATSRKPGIVWLLDAEQKTIEKVMQVSDHYRRGQGGLFALWVDNDFESQPYVYLAKAVPDGRKATTRLMRYRWQDDSLQEEKILFTAEPWVNNSGHFGGAISQDSSGHIYLSVGDRRQQQKAQSTDDHIGTIVRLQRDGKPVSDNPFVGEGRPEIFSYGHRNPQGIYLTEDDQIWSSEHGPQGGDEVNLIQPGKNYGWPVITHGEQYGGGKIGEGTAKPGMEQPVVHYTPSIATSDMLVYEHEAIASLQGDILVASLRSNTVSHLHQQQGQWQEKQRLFAGLNERWRSIKADRQGGIWLLAESGNLYRWSANSRQ